MKTPINFNNIRVGDTVEQVVRLDGCEVTRRGVVTATASTERGRTSVTIGSQSLISRADIEWHLLDRPKPAVDLPTDNALGYVEFADGRTHLGVWRHREGDRLFEGAQIDADYSSDCYRSSQVISFTPATAVPTEALDELRRVLDRCDATYPDYKKASYDFLAAIDKATS